MDFITRQALCTLSNSILVCNSKARRRNDVRCVEETWTETAEKMQQFDLEFQPDIHRNLKGS